MKKNLNRSQVNLDYEKKFIQKSMKSQRKNFQMKMKFYLTNSNNFNQNSLRPRLYCNIKMHKTIQFKSLHLLKTTSSNFKNPNKMFYKIQIC